jgi:hypothetical protein
MAFRVTMNTEYQVMTESQYEKLSNQLLDLHEAQLEALRIYRQTVVTQYGSKPWPNRFPLSGGVCAHWPQSTNQAIRKAGKAANDTLESSLHTWKLAGKQTRTWRGGGKFSLCQDC